MTRWYCTPRRLAMIPLTQSLLGWKQCSQIWHLCLLLVGTQSGSRILAWYPDPNSPYYGPQGPLAARINHSGLLRKASNIIIRAQTDQLQQKPPLRYCGSPNQPPQDLFETGRSEISSSWRKLPIAFNWLTSICQHLVLMLGGSPS